MKILRLNLTENFSKSDKISNYSNGNESINEHFLKFLFIESILMVQNKSDQFYAFLMNY